MLGAIIGDLAAWTWEHDRICFYKQLISEDAVSSCYGTALYNAAHSCFFPDKVNETKPVGSPEELSYFGQWLMWQIASAWYDQSLEEQTPHFYCIDKSEYYARYFVKELMNSLLNGCTKREAYHKCNSFEELSRSWQWRDGKQIDEKYSSGLLTCVFRAWNAFYLAYDFTSTIHNAVKCSGDIHLITAIAGAFASAMYGCHYNYIKKKYAEDDNIQSDLYFLAPRANEGAMRHLENMMIAKDDEDRKFFKKNCALTNVEKHLWTPSHVNLNNFIFNEEQKSFIVRAWYPDWDNRYGFYLDDGWVYFYRSQVLICRFQFMKFEKGQYCIVHLLDGDQHHDSNELVGWLNENMYLLEKLADV